MDLTRTIQDLDRVRFLFSWYFLVPMHVLNLYNGKRYILGGYNGVTLLLHIRILYKKSIRKINIILFYTAILKKIEYQRFFIH